MAAARARRRLSARTESCSTGTRSSNQLEDPIGPPILTRRSGSPWLCARWTKFLPDSAESLSSLRVGEPGGSSLSYDFLRVQPRSDLSGPTRRPIMHHRGSF